MSVLCLSAPGQFVVDSLSRSIRDKVTSGDLPATAPLKIWGGRGTGHACRGCGTLTAPTDIEFELDFPDGRTFRMHAGCFDIWRRAITGGVAGDDPPADDSAESAGR